MTGDSNYKKFLQTATRTHWDRVGVRRRAGVCAPLFSLHSKNSVGIGEIPIWSHSWTGANLLDLALSNFCP
jgi:hypothetical protein